MTPIEAPSPNFDERTLPITMIVLHYTGMEDGPSAIARLRDPEAKVSAHYVGRRTARSFAWCRRRSAPGTPASRTGAT